VLQAGRCLTPDGIFYLLNHAGLYMALGLTQPLREMNNGDQLGRGGGEVKAASA
jgi:hypothetical protein